MINEKKYSELLHFANAAGASVVAVSKLKSVSDIKLLYDLGQRDFGENYVQELVEKQPQLPADIRWHFIGHLQTNKVKFIAPFVHLIQSVDSEKLLQEINKQGEKLGRKIDCLLQVHIAEEQTKFGFELSELPAVAAVDYPNAGIVGLMGMATFTENHKIIALEFQRLKTSFDLLQSNNPDLRILSMGMSDDYETAVAAGSNMIRVGSLIFGRR